jgi:hypothetical protein
MFLIQSQQNFLEAKNIRFILLINIWIVYGLGFRNIVGPTFSLLDIYNLFRLLLAFACILGFCSSAFSHGARGTTSSVVGQISLSGYHRDNSFFAWDKAV